MYGGDFVGVVIFFYYYGNHMRRPPRSAAENVSRIIVLISWGLGVCDCVSCIRWLGLDPGRPAPVVMGVAFACCAGARAPN